MTISDAVMLLFAVALLYVVWAMAPAAAQTEAEYVERLCAGMEVEVRLDDGTRVDCLSDGVAYEADFSPKWAEAVGQSAYYSLKTDRVPGIILICTQQLETCMEHLRRTRETIEHLGGSWVLWMHSGGLPE